MDEQGYKLSERAARATAKVVRRFQPAVPSAAGTPHEPYRNPDPSFVVKITDSSGSVGTPYKYSWHEQYEVYSTGTLAYADYPTADGGRFGTKDTSGGAGDQGPAFNTVDFGPGPYFPPVPNGTYVRVRLSFDNQTPPNAVWRFEFIALPPLGQYQGWYGTIISGATIVTVGADYARCS